MKPERIFQIVTSNSVAFSRVLIIVLFLTITSGFQVSAQMPVNPGSDSPYANTVVEPFHIIDNFYFVGKTAHSSSYLITTEDGHILIDSTYEKSVPAILENIEKLGFNANDIKLLLSSHAHVDHVAGHALMKEVTGATILAPAADAKIIETGGGADYRGSTPWQPAKVDRIIKDGEKIQLGGTVLTAHLTPGHTKGCTTWTTVVEENGKQYDLMILGGVRMSTREPLVANPKYPNMPQDFAYSFAVLKTLPVDVYLGAHGYWYNVEEKLKRIKQGSSVNPFIDPEGYKRAIAGWEKAFLDALKAERGSRIP